MTERTSTPAALQETLHGWIPSLATPDEVGSALEKAFDYRGDITITLKNGSKVEGYVFDRRIRGKGLENCSVRVIPKEGPDKISIPFSEIAGLEFSGRDAAEGKSFELWLEKYRDRKAKGETAISLDPEPLE